MKVRHEEQFRQASTIDAEPTECGRDQFCRQQSFGEWPDEPDPYFLMLVCGKRWIDWTVEQWRLLYQGDEWPGWCRVEQDFADDPWLFRKCFPWREQA